MESIIQELRSIVNDFYIKARSIPHDDFSKKHTPGKWSRKEVFGHLIDSAHNNLRRFIAGQYDEDTKVTYEQDFWVTANAYQEMSQEEIMLLWKLMNERICAVLGGMPEENRERKVNTGTNSPEFHSILWLATDYVKHMKHHLNQVFSGAFDLIYP